MSLHLVKRFRNTKPGSPHIDSSTTESSPILSTLTTRSLGVESEGGFVISTGHLPSP
jgi:hypothetical protein